MTRQWFAPLSNLFQPMCGIIYAQTSRTNIKLASMCLRCSYITPIIANVAACFRIWNWHATYYNKYNYYGKWNGAQFYMFSILSWSLPRVTVVCAHVLVNISNIGQGSGSRLRITWLWVNIQVPLALCALNEIMDYGYAWSAYIFNGSLHCK